MNGVLINEVESSTTLILISTVIDHFRCSEHRMKSTTAKIATGFDVNIVGASCLFGVISGTVGFKQMQEINRRLKEVQ